MARKLAFGQLGKCFIFNLGKTLEAVHKQGAYTAMRSKGSTTAPLTRWRFAEVTMLSGTSGPLTIEKYAKEPDHNYNRVTLYLRSGEDFLPLAGKNSVHAPGGVK